MTKPDPPSGCLATLLRFFPGLLDSHSLVCLPLLLLSYVVPSVVLALFHDLIFLHELVGLLFFFLNSVSPLEDLLGLNGVVFCSQLHPSVCAE
ncbi:uncharacterized protein [Lolium perenne]|uniref:uncharacterized protein isoform X3 n=1 Tax=Lolium perenne TaxID=4522 RepID=UPI0021F574A3|nr:uncharacterized protein LOC127312190 isoform X6 [Lolium perenne]